MMLPRILIVCEYFLTITTGQSYACFREGAGLDRGERGQFFYAINELHNTHEKGFCMLLETLKDPMYTSSALSLNDYYKYIIWYKNL
jgi:hypothetical protein